MAGAVVYLIVFQSTPPARGATLTHFTQEEYDYLFQSTPPARGATEIVWSLNSCQFEISIHAPREGGDAPKIVESTTLYISIHAPARGATVPRGRGVVGHDISIHAPREGGRR